MSRRHGGQKPPYSGPPGNAQSPYQNPPDLYGHENYVHPPYGQSPRVPPSAQFQYPAQAYPVADANQYAFEQRDEHDYRPAKKPRLNPAAAEFPGPNPYQAYAHPYPEYSQTPRQYLPFPPHPAYGQGVPPLDPRYGPAPLPPANYIGPPFTPPLQHGYNPYAYGRPEHQMHYQYGAPYGHRDSGSPQSARNQHNQLKHWEANHGHNKRPVPAIHAPPVHGQASPAQAMHGQASPTHAIHGQASPPQGTNWQAAHGQVQAQYGQQKRFGSLQWKKPGYNQPASTQPANNQPANIQPANSQPPNTSDNTSTRQPANMSENTSTPATSPAARSDTASAAHSHGGSQASPGAQVGNGASVQKRKTGLNYDDSPDFDFENYYSEGDVQVDEKFALGPVNWTPGRIVKRALPAVYSEFASNPREHLSEPDAQNHESASVYNTASNVEEQSVSIQQSREWDNIKGDPVFAKIPQSGGTISMEQVVANRDQSVAAAGNQGVNDEEEEEGEITKEWNISDDNQKSLYTKPKGGSVNGHRATPGLDENKFDDDDEPYSPPPAKVRPAAPEFTSNEQVDEEETQSPYSPKPHNAESPALRGSESNTVRATNVDSGKENPVAPPGHATKEPQRDMEKHGLPKASIFSLKGRTQPPVDPSNAQKYSPLAKPLEFVRDPAQEDALAKLGVTGDAKPVRGTPGLATNPPPSHALVPHGEAYGARVNANGSHGGYAAGVSKSLAPPPPPPPPPPMEEGDANIPQEDDGKLWSPARSDASGKTQIASDYQEERTGSSTQEKPQDTVNEEAQKKFEIGPGRDASGDLHEGVHDTVVKDPKKLVDIGPHEEPAGEIREEPHDAAVKGNQKEVGTGLHNGAAEKIHKGTNDTEIQGEAQNESHEVSQGEVQEQHRNEVEEDEASAEEDPIVTTPNTSASAISAPNLPAPNGPASNASAANVPAASILPPNAPAASIPPPNAPAATIPPRQSPRKRKADPEESEEADDGKKRQKKDTKSRRKGKPAVPVDPAYNTRW